jgi:hypothetical protein
VGHRVAMADDPSSLEFQPRVAGGVLGFPAHDGRASALGEVHSRPYPLIEAPRVLIQLAFMTEGGSSVDYAVLTSLSRRLGIAAPDRQARHHAMKWGKGSVRWERHTEFSTYLWEGPLPTSPDEQEDSPFGNGFSPPGTVISAIRLEIRKWNAANEKLIATFDPTSLCYSVIENGNAAIMTDFRQDGDGLTRRRDEIVADMRHRAGRGRDRRAARHARPSSPTALTAYRQPPLVVVLPETVAQVSRILRYCHERRASGGAARRRHLAVGRRAAAGRRGAAGHEASSTACSTSTIANRCAVVQPGVTNLGITRRSSTKASTTRPIRPRRSPARSAATSRRIPAACTA